MATYPTLSTGARCSLPYAYRREYLNTVCDVASGKRYAYNHRATPLMKWTLQYPQLSDADVTTLRTFFDSVKGSWDVFDFTDPETNTNYAQCRLGSDRFEVQRVGPNENSVTLVIQEYA